MKFTMRTMIWVLRKTFRTRNIIMPLKFLLRFFLGVRLGRSGKLTPDHRLLKKAWRASSLVVASSSPFATRSRIMRLVGIVASAIVVLCNLLLFGFMRRKRAELARVRAEQEKRA